MHIVMQLKMISTTALFHNNSLIVNTSSLVKDGNGISNVQQTVRYEF